MSDEVESDAAEDADEADERFPTSPPDGLPLISVLTPVYNTEPGMLRDMIESVRHQGYPHWELCLVDDCSTRPETLDVLSHYGWLDPRVRVRRRETNGNISRASNDALAMAVGDYVALLDHDDLLHLDALGAVAHELMRDPTLDYVYSDEDKVDEDGVYGEAYHKPDWSPELLYGQMFTSHLSVYRRENVVRVGGFRVGFEGSQDWDLCLRVTETTDRIHHIPRVLYHWRKHAESTSASIEAKPYAVQAGHKAIAEALVRRKIKGNVVDSHIGGHFHIERYPEGNPLVSAIIPTRGGRREVRGEDVRLVDKAVQSLVDSDYDNWEAVVVLSDGTDPDLKPELSALAPGRLRFVERPGPFDFSAAINAGAVQAQGELILLLNDDVEAKNEHWLRRLVAWLDDPGIGVVGSKLWFENDTVQHAGIVGIDGTPVHAWRRWDNGPGYFGELMLTKNYLAVTGACLLTRAVDFETVGGLSLRFPVNFNDVDYCLKLRELGMRTVFEPRSELYHYESSSRTSDVWMSEMAEFHHRWGNIASFDPYWSRARYPTLNPLLATS